MKTKNSELTPEQKAEIHKYIEQILDAYGNFGSSKKIKLCERFFSKKPNKSFLDAVDILKDIIVLPKSIRDLYGEVDINSKVNMATDRELSKSQINDILRILKCNDLIYQHEKNYHIDYMRWYKDIRYKIKDSKTLQELAPLLLSYLKIDASYKPNDFFMILDIFLDYILQKSIGHNKNLEVEKAIYETISQSNGKIKITDKTTQKEIMIKPENIDIVFNEEKQVDEKILVYEDIADSKTKQIDIMNIRLFSIPSQTKVYQEGVSMQEKAEILLAINLVLYEYFQNIDVFAQMEFITDKLEIHNTLDLPQEKIFNKLYLDFSKETPSADIFLLKISGDYDEDLLVQEVQKNLQYIKVISPSTITETIKNNMLLYQKNLAL